MMMRSATKGVMGGGAKQPEVVAGWSPFSSCLITSLPHRHAWRQEIRLRHVFFPRGGVCEKRGSAMCTASSSPEYENETSPCFFPRGRSMKMRHCPCIFSSFQWNEQ
jgi:hypothetical protein